DVAHEELAGVLLWPGAAEIAHQPAVSVAAAGRVALVVAAVRIRADVVSVVGYGRDVGIGVRIEVGPRLALVAPALDNVVEVRDDARLNEEVADCVVV